jgi:hypothetical protein
MLYNSVHQPDSAANMTWTANMSFTPHFVPTRVAQRCMTEPHSPQSGGHVMPAAGLEPPAQPSTVHMHSVVVVCPMASHALLLLKCCVPVACSL